MVNENLLQEIDSALLEAQQTSRSQLNDIYLDIKDNIIYVSFDSGHTESFNNIDECKDFLVNLYKSNVPYTDICDICNRKYLREADNILNLCDECYENQIR